MIRFLIFVFKNCEFEFCQIRCATCDNDGNLGTIEPYSLLLSNINNTELVSIVAELLYNSPTC